MKKMMIISLMFLMLMVGLVSAADVEIPNGQISYVDGFAEPGSALFVFVSPTTTNDVRATYKADVPNAFQKTSSLGSLCNVGEYISVYRCHTQWSECQRVFKDDWKKTSSTDLLPIYKWANEAVFTYENPGVNWWYGDGESYHIWDMYQCKVVNTESKPAAADVTDNGYFSGSISYNSKVNTNDYITVRGSYYARKSGPVVLEAFVNVKSQKPLAVGVPVVSSRSSCDGSSFWAGKEIVAVAGQRYDYAFTVKTPSEEGQYDVEVHAWTGCYKDGGQYIDSTKGTVVVKQATSCDVKRAVTELGKWYLKNNPASLFINWNPSSTDAQKEVAKWGCTATDVKRWCGTTDTDSDGIPDGCDYCPRDKGIPSDTNGCHPCFGMDIYSSAAKECYRTFGDDYGIPDRVIDFINPIVGKKESCLDENTIKVDLVRDFGDVAASKTTDCPAGQVCKANNNVASCSPKELKPVDTVKVCSDDGYTIQIKTIYDDGSSKITNSNVDICSNGCLSGSCIPETSGVTCEGGRECGEGTNGVVVEGGCSTDNDCREGFCLSGTCQTNKDSCVISSDCDANQFCNTGGECEDLEQEECSVDSDCSSEFYGCVDNKCIISFGPGGEDNPVIWEDFNESESCIDDTFVTCQSGGSVIVATCVDGVSIPTSRTCVDGVSGGDFIQKTPVIRDVASSLSDSSTEQKVTYSVVALLVIVSLGYIFVFGKGKFIKRGKRK